MVNSAIYINKKYLIKIYIAKIFNYIYYYMNNDFYTELFQDF